MCEYCGCQALTAIAELTREHDEVVALISKVRAAHGAGDVAGMAHWASRIAEVLGPHTAVEERGLFPPLADEFPEHVAGLTMQHRQIESVLAEATGGAPADQTPPAVPADQTPPADPTWPSRLLDALHLLREHILAEQDGVFPAALSRLDTAHWEAIDAVRDQVGTAIPAPAG